ncbi:MAG: enoyl-CoA hydratase-related protein [Xanthobacteraceae bacterium]
MARAQAGVTEMSQGGDIAIDMTGAVATLRLRNPARRNAVSAAMWRAIRTFVSEVSASDDVRVVVIRGDGDRAFSAGADIADSEITRNGAANARAYDDLVEDTCQLIEAIARPTIAVIIGPCMGAGASLAASCDLRIAADNAFFAVPAARLGLGYDPRGIKRFLRVFGTNATCELIFTGERLPAERAHQLGTVAALIPAADIDRVAAEWAGRIADNAPLTIAAAKMAVQAHLSGDATRLAEAGRLYAAADASADYVEGRRAFIEKRPPRFTGS